MICGVVFAYFLHLAGLRLVPQLLTAALALPTALPPGNESVALACFTYIYSPTALSSLLTPAIDKIRQLGCSLEDIPSAEEIGRALLRNRTATKLGLKEEGKALSSSSKAAQAPEMLIGEGSCLPLDIGWAYSKVQN